MTARTMTVTHVNRWCTFLRGYGTRELITEITGRPPLWSATARAWVAQEQTARDIVAAAEARGWRVDVVNEEHLARLVGEEKAEERGTLW